MVDKDFVEDFEEEEALVAHVDANQGWEIDIDTLVDRVAGVGTRIYEERLPRDSPHIAGELFPVNSNAVIVGALLLGIQETCVDHEFERVATPADYLAAAGEVETFEGVKEGHKSIPVEENAINDGKEFWAILGAAIACDDVAFERNTRVGSVKDAVVMDICFTGEAEKVADV